MIFDVESRVIVATVWPSTTTPLPSETWIFDVCTCTWRRGADVPIEVRSLVYHQGEDLTVGLGWTERGDPSTWTYDVESDTWSEMAPLPGEVNFLMAAFDSESGLIYVGWVGDRWAYDLADDAWSQVPGGAPDPSVVVMVYDPSVSAFVAATLPTASGSFMGSGPLPLAVTTWLVNLESGEWTEAGPGHLPPFAFGDLVSGGEAVFDGATGRVAVFSNGTLVEYDAAAHEWVTLVKPDHYEDGMAAGPLARIGGSIVYDPVNQRIVVWGGSDRDDLWAFDPLAGEWMLLVEPTIGTDQN